MSADGGAPQTRRERSVVVRVFDDELERIDALARGAGLGRSEWIRAQAMKGEGVMEHKLDGLVAIIREGLDVMRTRDGIDVPAALAEERARNISQAVLHYIDEQEEEGEKDDSEAGR